jgi:Kef-type K+ transport system membrane component KefB
MKVENAALCGDVNLCWSVWHQPRCTPPRPPNPLQLELTYGLDLHALGLIFAPFTIKTLIFVGACVAILIFLPWITAQFFRLYGGRPSELETKYLLLLLFGLGGLAGWADSEAVLPAYLIGMILAGTPSHSLSSVPS